MAGRIKRGSGFRPSAAVGAVFLSLALLLFFGLVSHAHW